MAQIAQEYDATHLAWTADLRNTRELSFYARLGAEITEQKNHRCFFTWIPWRATTESSLIGALHI